MRLPDIAKARIREPNEYLVARADHRIADCQARRRAAILKARRLPESRNPDTGLPESC